MSRYLAIDLDPQGLFVAAGSVRGGSAKVDAALAWTAADGDGPPPLTAETAQAIGEQLKERLRSAGITPAPVLVCVGRDKVILKELRYPAVPPSEEPALVRFQAVKELTESPDDIVLDYAPLANGVADAGAERRSMAVAVRKEVFAAIQAMCTAAGLKLAGVSPRPYAVAAALNRAFATGATLPPGDPADAVAVLTPGSQGGEFTVVRGGQVGFTRAVAPQVLASETLLLNEVRRNLTVHAGQNPEHPAQAVYVAEAEEAGAVWSGRLRDALALPVHPFDPLAGAAEDVAAGLRGRFAGAVGLLAGRAADALPINFAAPRQPVVEADPKRKQLLLAVLAFLLLAVVGGGLGYMKLDAADQEYARLLQQKRDLDKDLADLEGDGNAKRLEEVDKWEAKSVCWLDELFDVADRWPEKDQVRAFVFDAKAIPPGKDGKQIAQADVQVRVGTRNPDAVDRIVLAINRDNTEKSRYYIGTNKLTVGSLGSNPNFNQLFTIVTKVNHRQPDQYTRQPAGVTTPKRRATASPATALPGEDD